MKKKAFAIPSLLAAGFLPAETLAMPLKPSMDLGDNTKSMFDVFRMDHDFTLAGHRSHSSHRSHRSHSSHRSSTGGYSYRAPSYSAPSRSYVAPLYNPPVKTAPSPAPQYYPPSPPGSGSAGTAAPLKALPGNTDRFKEIVKQVQLAMLAYGYYTGDIDGIVGPAMRAGLQKLQSDYGLKATGTITPETLDALRISAS
ncbi:His-Xaa-Ser repeat protein HxsA [Brucella intermedia]|uniref:His-Xaa-Ser repeat protein HxsA n=1 Tax=Brucella intermedia TaxID=94625 RepID=UPI00224B40D0|nr:His-Xaa-Ser repeat protein HxsA [Brucella intermedia]